MNRRDTSLIKKITCEYIDFVKKTNAAIEETRKATVIALEKALNLNNGDKILINEDGSIEIEPAANN